jgi:fructose-1,6-bisphosphatase II
MGSPRFEIALDPIDGTTNIAYGLPNSISVMAASQATEGSPHVMRNLPTFYSEKLAYGPDVVRAIERGMPSISLDDPIAQTLGRIAEALGKRVSELVVMTLKRDRHEEFIASVRKAGAALRLITDGDITAAVSPSLADSAVDLYYGIGGSPEGILTAAALNALGGEMLLRMRPRDEAERAEAIAAVGEKDLTRIYRCRELIWGDSCIFCATGISDSPLLPGVKLVGKKAITHSILMRSRSRTVRYIRAIHDLESKTIHLRSAQADRKL